METLPAWKITQFHGEPARGPVYAYLRCYMRGGTLCCCAAVFDSAPRPTARFGFAFTPLAGAERYLFLSVGKDCPASLRLYETGGEQDQPLRVLAPPPVRRSAGSDEQGEYWSAETEISADIFAGAFGRVPQSGDLLGANIFLYDEAEAAFGAACRVPDGCGVPTARGFGTLVLTPF